MPRTYIAFVNDRKAGLTWSALVAASLIMMNKTCSPIEIALHIWGKKNPPQDLYSRIHVALDQGLDKGFFVKLKRGNWAITALGHRVFNHHMNTDMNLRQQSDSILFERAGKK